MAGPGILSLPFFLLNSLTAVLAEHEETLAQVRARLAHPPSGLQPTDPVKASLYLAWKKALQVGGLEWANCS